MKNKFTALIAVRKGSQRVKNKNIKPFCNSSLLEIKIKQAIKCPLIDEVVVSSNCDYMLSIAKKYNVITHKRKEYYCSNTVPMNIVYEHLAKNLKCDHIVYLHVTSPLLKDESLLKAIQEYKNNICSYDSLASVEHFKKYIWYNNKAVNYDPGNHPRSQDLPDYCSLNFAINIISKKKMIEKRNIIGDKFYPYYLDEIESIDVDNKIDFKIAEFLYKEENYERRNKA
tara:strand:+ start:328 stop:1008 length:681 start_codon:yes stop_codon:yes gene_type:complete